MSFISGRLAPSSFTPQGSPFWPWIHSSVLLHFPLSSLPCLTLQCSQSSYALQEGEAGSSHCQPALERLRVLWPPSQQFLQTTGCIQIHPLQSLSAQNRLHCHPNTKFLSWSQMFEKVGANACTWQLPHSVQFCLQYGMALMVWIASNPKPLAIPTCNVVQCRSHIRRIWWVLIWR